jgi:DNA-binding YbaB/EbfC family protein
MMKSALTTAFILKTSFEQASFACSQFVATKGKEAMRDMLGLMKQAQAMQAKMQEMQAEMERTEVEGQAGGGMVRVTLTAKGQMKGLAIDDQLLKADEKVILEDLIVVAHEDARKKAERVMEEKMKGMTAGLSLPPGMKLPF